MAAPNPNVRSISDEQAQALTEAIVACEADQDDDHPVNELVAGIRSILGAAVIVFCRRGDAWSAMSPRAPHPLTSSLAQSLDRALASDAVARQIAGEDWTLVRGSDQELRMALAVQGDWTLSANPLVRIARLIQLKLDRAGERAAIRSSTRLLHRMMRQLARVDGMAKIGETVLRYAAAAVGARVGAIAVMPAGQDRASIVATFGYPRVLVEHMQIESGVGVIGTVLQSGRPIRETGIDPSMRVRRPRYRTSSFVAVPILTARETLGVLCVTDKRNDGIFSTRDTAALRMFAAGAALALARERAMRAADSYAHAAAVDPVTNLFNRRYFQVRLDEELQRSKRHQIPIALLLIDVDDFKAVNDSAGHLAGDVVLRDLGEILRSCVRVFDVCARFGGEEFVIIMPGGTKENAFRIAERIRRRVEAYHPSEPSMEGLRITVSIGFSVSSATTAVSELLDLSDKALYAAKHAGKNCIKSAEIASSEKTVGSEKPSGKKEKKEKKEERE
jgi:diguanylate cyclase (GGDEF)-like protein